MTAIDDTFIGDVPMSQVLRALPHMRTWLGDDGMRHVEMTAPKEDAEPFFRALRWLEADLMRDDAETLEYEYEREIRSNEQRTADAFIDLMSHVTAALDRGRGAA